MHTRSFEISPAPAAQRLVRASKPHKSLARQVKSLSRAVDYQEAKTKQRSVIGNIVALTHLVQPKPRLQPVASPDPVPVTQLYYSIQKQQELMLEMLQQMHSRRLDDLRNYSPSPQSYTPHAAPYTPFSARSRHTEFRPLKTRATVVPKQAEDDDEPLPPVFTTPITNQKRIKQVLAEYGVSEEEEEPAAFNPYMSSEAKKEYLKTLVAKRKYQAVAPPRVKLNRFRVAAFAVLFLFVYMSEARARRVLFRERWLVEFQDSLSVYLEVAKTWARKAVRAPLYSLLSDSETDLDLRGRQSTIRQRLLKAQVKVRGVIEGVFQAIPLMNSGMLRLLHSLYQEKVPLPRNYFLPFEEARLEFDETGQLQRMTEERQQMMVSFFVFVRVVVGIFLDKEEIGFQDPTSVVARYSSHRNTRLVASLVHYAVLRAFVRTGLDSDKADILEQALLRTRPAQGTLKVLLYVGKPNATGSSADL